MKNKILVITTIMLIISAIAYTQESGKVLLEPISKKYEGECKRGKAEGFGKASGVDKYEGNFKKGLPDGEGTYTWEDGDIYTGEWKKGEREGKGKMIYMTEGKQDSIKDGFWSKDEYIGKYKVPYKIISYNNLDRVVLKNLADTPERIYFKISDNMGGMNNNKALRFKVSNKIPVNNKYIDATFPILLDIEFTFPIKAGIREEKVFCTAKIEIYEAGKWEVILDVINTN